MARNWAQEMELDENMTAEEIVRFINIIEATGIPSIEEYAEAEDKARNEIQDEYWDKYGDTIRAARDEATEELIELENNKRKNENLIEKINNSYNEEKIAKYMIDHDIYKIDDTPLEKEKRITALRVLISKSQQLSDLMVSQEVLQTAIRIATGNDEDKIKELIALAKDRIRNDKNNMYHDLLDVKRYQG